jgi:hypothetical protein
VFGVSYSADPYLQLGVEEVDPDLGTGSTDSDYGKRFDIQRVPPEDAILYQTERYSTAPSFSYSITLPPPSNKDAEFVLVLKFAEVYFRSPGQKVGKICICK